MAEKFKVSFPSQASTDIEREDPRLNRAAFVEMLLLNPQQVKAIQPRSRRSHYRAAINWMMLHQSSADASNLVKVQGFLEAFHHFCEVEDWGRARLIFQLESPPLLPDTLYRQLNVWGDYFSSIELCCQMLGKFDDEFDAIVLNAWGNSCNELARYEEAIVLYERALESAQRIGNDEFMAAH